MVGSQIESISWMSAEGYVAALKRSNSTAMGRLLAYPWRFSVIYVYGNHNSWAFHGLGKIHPPSIVGITLIGARIPMAMVLSGMMGLNGIWWAITISSIGKGLVLFGWFQYGLRKSELLHAKHLLVQK